MLTFQLSPTNVRYNLHIQYTDEVTKDNYTTLHYIKNITKFLHWLTKEELSK